MELPQYRMILLATDGSDVAGLAAPHAVALAALAGASLTVLYVVDTHLAFRLGIHQHEALRELRLEGEQALENVAELAEKAQVHVVKELRDGRPAEIILQEAERLHADLIVVGSQGQGALSGMLLGSVSQHVLHNAHVPVCLIRPSQ